MKGLAAVFAGELNLSATLWVGSAGNSSLILTPSGALCGLVYIAGALIEKEGRRGDIMHARIADPTGAYDIHVSRSQGDLAETLSLIEPPVFVTGVGMASLAGETGRSHCYLQLEEIREVNRNTRDNWIIRTGTLTCERIALMSTYLQTGRAPEPYARAADFYKMTPARLGDLAVMVRSALAAVSPLEDDRAAPDSREIVISIMKEHGSVKGIPLDEIASRASRFGLGRDEVTRLVHLLLSEDECYQPAKGVFKLL